MENSISVIFASIVAFLIAVLSGLGVGSGGLFVIWLVSVYGVSAPQARGMNLLFFVFSASAAFLIHLAKGRLDLNFISKLAFFALIGTFLGTFVARYIDPIMLRKIFGVFLIISGIYTFFSKTFTKKRSSHANNPPFIEKAPK